VPNIDGALRFDRERKFSGETIWSGLYILRKRTDAGYFSIGYDSTHRRGLILQIEISEPLQGKGLGRIFVGKCEDFLKSKGARILVANSVSQNAIGFWRALGYEPDGSGDMFKGVGGQLLF